MSLQVLANYPLVVLYARKSRELGKLASVVQGSQTKNTLLKKAAVDALLVRELEKTASSILSRFKSLGAAAKMKEGSLGLGKGLAIGTGIAVPTLAAGGYLIDRSGQETEDRMNSILTRGSLLAGGVGAGLLGLNQLGKHLDSKSRMQERSHSAGLQASLEALRAKRAQDDTVLFEKASACYSAIEVLRKTIDTNEHSESLCKRAAEVLVVANGHLADIAGDILLGE
jgi:hypothetical protein